MKVKTLSAGMVVTQQLNHECVYLLLRAYNYWDFPKGTVQPAEDPFEAACREVEEETSLR
ncbi:MAG: NUDIX domain-containing protein, partial [Gammaproteobacteria bacterium]